MTEDTVEMKHSGTWNGTVSLRDPNGGAMGIALEQADAGGGNIKATAMINALIPYCVRGPESWVGTPIKDVVSQLHYQDYMALFKGVKERLRALTPEQQGESAAPSTQDGSQETPGSDGASSTTTS